jgi:hypothetical protein
VKTVLAIVVLLAALGAVGKGFSWVGGTPPAPRAYDPMNPPADLSAWGRN